MDPRTALAAYRASCRTSSQRIKHFFARRKGFALAYNNAEELDDMVGVVVDKIDGLNEGSFPDSSFPQIHSGLFISGLFIPT
jgi:hypothetical protein